MSKTIKRLKVLAWKEYSQYIRLRDCLKTTGLPDYGKCITCQKIIPRTLGQAGHFVAGRHNANLFSEKGTNLQCYNCNINLRGNTLEYRRKIIEIYGVGADEELEAEAKKTKKFTVETLEQLRAEIKEKTDGLLARWVEEKKRREIP